MVTGSGKPQLLQQVWVLVRQRCQRIAHGEHRYAIVLEEYVVPAMHGKSRVCEVKMHSVQWMSQPDPTRLLNHLHGAC